MSLAIITPLQKAAASENTTNEYISRCLTEKVFVSFYVGWTPLDPQSCDLD